MYRAARHPLTGHGIHPEQLRHDLPAHGPADVQQELLPIVEQENSRAAQLLRGRRQRDRHVHTLSRPSPDPFHPAPSRSALRGCCCCWRRRDGGRRVSYVRRQVVQGVQGRVENSHHIDDGQALTGQQPRRAFVRADVRRRALRIRLFGVRLAVSGTARRKQGGGGGVTGRGEERQRGDKNMPDNANESPHTHTRPRTVRSKLTTTRLVCTSTRTSMATPTHTQPTLELGLRASILCVHRVKSGTTLSPSGRISCPAGESEAHFLR